MLADLAIYEPRTFQVCLLMLNIYISCLIYLTTGELCTVQGMIYWLVNELSAVVSNEDASPCGDTHDQAFEDLVICSRSLLLTQLQIHWCDVIYMVRYHQNHWCHADYVLGHDWDDWCDLIDIVTLLQGHGHSVISSVTWKNGPSCFLQLFRGKK